MHIGHSTGGAEVVSYVACHQDRVANEGKSQFRVGDAELSGRPGTTVVIPRAAYHTFVTATGGKVFVSAPAGNEKLFEELGRVGPSPTDEQLAEIDESMNTTRLPATKAAPGPVSCHDRDRQPEALSPDAAALTH